MGYSPRGHKESDMIERLHFQFLFIFHSLQVQRKEYSNYWSGVVLCGATASVPPEDPVLLTIAFAISVQTQYSEKSK